jgi:hypothetical protein
MALFWGEGGGVGGGEKGEGGGVVVEGGVGGVEGGRGWDGRTGAGLRSGW